MLMILKVCGMLLVVACTTSIGIAMAQALSRRVRELEGCIALLTGMEGELSYSLAPPDEAVARLEERESAQEAPFLACGKGVPFLPACAALCRKGTPFPQAWREAVAKQGGSLTREDAAIVEALADTLGQCDLDGQLSSLSHAKALLAMQLAAARERCESHGKLYRTMGLLAGAFVVVFFI